MHWLTDRRRSFNCFLRTIWEQLGWHTATNSCDNTDVYWESDGLTDSFGTLFHSLLLRENTPTPNLLEPIKNNLTHSFQLHRYNRLISRRHAAKKLFWQLTFKSTHIADYLTSISAKYELCNKTTKKISVFSQFLCHKILSCFAHHRL
jgi:hypothetical protein